LEELKGQRPSFLKDRLGGLGAGGPTGKVTGGPEVRGLENAVGVREVLFPQVNVPVGHGRVGVNLVVAQGT
jgi:hypothetical protein